MQHWSPHIHQVYQRLVQVSPAAVPSVIVVRTTQLPPTTAALDLANTSQDALILLPSPATALPVVAV